MFKYNKLRYWLGLPCVVTTNGLFVVSKRTFVIRVYLSNDEYLWWGASYREQYCKGFETVEESYDHYNKQKIKPV